MVYTMKIYVDGGCRGNGQPGAIGAAAAVFQFKWGKQRAWTRVLPRHPRPTNQRAEITAIILALELALERYRNLDSYPWIDVKIYSDSKYAVNCMNVWMDKWSNSKSITQSSNAESLMTPRHDHSPKLIPQIRLYAG